MAKPDNKTFDMITIGSATWDAIVTADDTRLVEEAGTKLVAYPYGQKVYLENAFFGFGGGASNVAVSAARLGLKVSFVGAIGTHHIGDSIMENFASEGVSAKHVKHDSEHDSGMSIVLSAPDGERTVLLFRGANEHLGHADVDWVHCRDTHWLFVSSLSGEAGKLYDEVAELARANHLKLALNPGRTQIKRGTKGMHKALEACDILLLNDEEAAELLRQRGQAGETVPEMLAALQEITGGIVVITRGGDGAEAYDGETRYTIAAFSKKRVNSLGAGDGFGSAFVCAIQKGLAIDESLRYASINASSVVSDYGAQTALLSWAELERRAADNPKFQPKRP